MGILHYLTKGIERAFDIVYARTIKSTLEKI